MALEINKKIQLGKGATATIYQASDGENTFAAKVYNKDTKLNKAKINAMLSNVPDHVTVDFAGITYPQLAWPLKIIMSDQQEPIGYLMPLIDLKDSFPLDYYYDKILFKKLNAPDEAALSFKLEVARNLASVVDDLHNNGHYFIDLKPQNIRVFRRSHIVTLLDCDGFSIKSKTGDRYPAELISTDYIAPEVSSGNILPKDLGVAQDRYALAVILFQLLNHGTHPFQGILKTSAPSINTNDEKAAAGLYPHGLTPHPRISPRPQSTHHLWLDTTRELFDRSFIGAPNNRPSAGEWAGHFDKLLVDKELARCDKEPVNITHMRFRDHPCPTCYLDKVAKTSQRKPNATPNKNHAKVTPPKKAKANDWNAVWVIVGIVFLLFVINKCSNNTNNQEVAPAVDAPLASSQQPSYELADINNLIWASSSNPMNWNDGNEFCNSQGSGSRLPTVAEIRAKNKAGLALGPYWSSEGNLAGGHYIVWGDNTSFTHPNSELNKILCVSNNQDKSEQSDSVNELNESNYAAAYYSKNGKVGLSIGWESLEKADKSAKSSCLKKGYGCEKWFAMAQPGPCISVAVGSEHIYSGFGLTKDQAENDAIVSCNKTDTACAISPNTSICEQ